MLNCSLWSKNTNYINESKVRSGIQLRVNCLKECQAKEPIICKKYANKKQLFN